MLEGTGHFHNKDDTGNRSSYRSRKESRHRYDDDIRVKERVKKSKSDHDIADNAANYHTYTLTFKGGVGVEQNTYNSLSIKGIESGVVVEGAQLEELIEVYSVQGMLVAQSTVNGTMTIHGLSSNTIYLVKIGSYVTRVMTK